MTFDYLRSRATADRLIANFGQVGAIRRKTVTGGDAFDPSTGTATSPDTPCTLVVTDYSLHERDGVRVLSTDKKVLIAAGGLAIEPKPSDKIVIGGIPHEIVAPDKGNGIKPIAPAGVVVMYEAQCRR